MFILAVPISTEPPNIIGASGHGPFGQPPTANQLYDLVERLFKKHEEDLRLAGEAQKEKEKEKLEIAGLENFPVNLEVASGSINFDGEEYKYSFNLSSSEGRNGYNIVLDLDNQVYSAGSEYLFGLDIDHGEKKVFCYGGGMDNIPVEIEETKGDNPIKITMHKKYIHDEELRMACVRFAKVLTMALNEFVSKS